MNLLGWLVFVSISLTGAPSSRAQPWVQVVDFPVLGVHHRHCHGLDKPGAPVRMLQVFSFWGKAGPGRGGAGDTLRAIS